MASQRLTEDLRKRIVNAALEDTFGKREQRLTEKRVEIAFAVREEYLRKKGIAEYIANVPNEIANLEKFVKLHYGEGPGEVECLPFSPEEDKRYNSGTGLRYAMPRNPIPLKDFSRKVQGQFHAMRQDQKRISDQKKDLRDALIGLVWSVNTVRQLVEEWPAGEKYIPAKEISNVPAVRGITVSQKIHEYAENDQ